MPRASSATRVALAVLAAGSLVLGLVGTTVGPAAAAPDRPGDLAALHSLRSPVTDENFYFVMADRFENGNRANDDGGLGADPLVSGFDPTKKGFYNGGDLAGLRQRLDYIEGLGTTSIWLTPSFKNKAVQLEDGPSAGYHGYWITDFTRIDPHLGTNNDLKRLIDAAHKRGMKVYFDIITNHTADVIGYEEGARQGYVSKDEEPYRTATGKAFDDRDYAGTGDFPKLSRTGSFPYTPVLAKGEQDLKKPGWLNDVTLYHNRGDTTFSGENSYYGDFFGLDDLFTEHPRVVRGMVDIYKGWIRDFGVDGFRIDTMKHVDDEFWQAFGPQVLRYAREQGKREFFMFGEVFDTTKSFTSHFTTTDRMQAVLDFPFQDAARNFASRGQSPEKLTTFFAGDDWYTDRNSNAYQLPTFLGNHDMGRIGSFVSSDNSGAPESELLARDRLAHQLMFFSRGNPVIYYGDEQGFTGSGGDQLARQTLFASKVEEYWDDDLLGTDRTHKQDNFVTSHPLYRAIKRLSAVTERNPALRNGAQQHRYADAEAGLYAFSRIGRKAQREYVVVLNNSETTRTATVPTYMKGARFTKVYGPGEPRLRTDARRSLAVTVPALTSVVYRAAQPIARSKAAPSVTLGRPLPSEESRGRMHVSADVDGSSFYEVTFYARVGNGRWRPIGTDDSAPYQVFHDVSALAPRTDVAYRAVVLDNAGDTAMSNRRKAVVPEPVLTIEAPREGSKVRTTVEVRATADPERADHVVSFQRRVDGGPPQAIGTDSSSPTYTEFDDISGLREGQRVEYVATLALPGGRSVQATRSVVVAGAPVTTAVLRYFRSDGRYADWGLHIFGEGIDFGRLPPAEGGGIEWEDPLNYARVQDGWAVFEIPIKDDTEPVGFIIHKPSGDSVPDTREPGGDRSFLPIEDAEVWVRSGDATVYGDKP